MKEVYRFYIEVEEMGKMPTRDQMMNCPEVIKAYPIYNERHKEVWRFRNKKKITTRKLRKYQIILKAANELLSAESSK